MHEHVPTNYNRVFLAGVILNLVYVAVEAGYGLAVGSLALIADAGHNFSDVIGLLLAWAGYALSQLPPTQHRTYGWRGASILAALFNAQLLLVAIGAIVWEAVRRLGEAAPIVGATVMIVAGVGVVINTLTALLFLKGREQDLNIQGAFLHMAADAAVSVGVVVSGLGIALLQWQWLDPVTGLIVALMIFVGTWSLLKGSVNMALQTAPEHLDVARIQASLEKIPGVASLHDLHVWSISTTETALTAHAVVTNVDQADAVLLHATRSMADEFGIHHVTLQTESGSAEFKCPLAEPGSV